MNHVVKFQFLDKNGEEIGLISSEKIQRKKRGKSVGWGLLGSKGADN